MRLLICLAALALGGTVLAKDPTLYEYYTSGGIKSGLEANHPDHFILNGKPYIIYSGSFHYFRVVPENWRPILQRFKAAGLNSVQLYLPWNLHEAIPGHMDFHSPSLNLGKFLEMIKEEDMFAIVRPGPYICAEWEMGGFPSWLLRDPHMHLRSNYKPYLERVKLYWDHALKIINKYQFSTTGGPVIMLQTENEFSFDISQHHQSSVEYLNFLHDEVRRSGFKQLIFNSDPGSNAQKVLIKGVYKDNSVLQTANLNSNTLKLLTEMKRNQPSKPAYVSEFWPGWFDLWSEKHAEQHHTYSVQKFEHEVSDLLFKANGSVNFYMFIGGTNFGFMNGGRKVTSYDYDSPLSEAGNYTAKYHKTRELYQKLVASGRMPKLHLPDVPPAPQAHAYGKVPIHETLPLESLLMHAHKFSGLKKPVPMELLNIGKDYGQQFGFVLYRVTGHEAASYEVTGNIRDHATFLVNHQETQVIADGAPHFMHKFAHHGSGHSVTYDLLVENLGRENGGSIMNYDRKGILDGDIKLDGQVVHNLTIYSLDFSRHFVESLKSGWGKFDATHVAHVHAPAMYRATLKVDHNTPQDTYLLMDGWTKGSVFVNGFNIGRYWKVGPQKTLYVPGPLLKKGENIIEVFEQHKPGHELHFIDHAILQ